MLISLDKNKWLYDWLQENYQDELYNIITAEEKAILRPNELRARLVQLLNEKGYKTKLTTKHDIIISLKEEEFIFLKLKYF